MGDYRQINIVIVGSLIPIFFALLLIGKNLILMIASAIVYIAISSIIAQILFSDVNIFDFWDIQNTSSESIYYIGLSIAIPLLFIAVNMRELFEFSVIYLFTVIISIVAGKRILQFDNIGYKEALSLLIPALSMPYLFFYHEIINEGIVSAIGSESPEIIIVYLILVGVIAPICEELFFRGVILYALKGHTVLVSSFIDALIFAIFHTLVYGENLYALVYVFCLGYSLSLAAIITRNIAPSVLYHMFNNTMAVLMIILLL